jgi:hypothetical protein
MKSIFTSALISGLATVGYADLTSDKAKAQLFQISALSTHLFTDEKILYTYPGQVLSIDRLDTEKDNMGIAGYFLSD